MEHECCKVSTSPAERDLGIILNTHLAQISRLVAKKKG